MCEFNGKMFYMSFDSSGSGLPDKVVINGSNGYRHTLIKPGGYVFELELASGEILRPAGGNCLTFERDEIQYIEFHQIKWQTAAKKVYPGLNSSFCYELHPDGTIFTHGFFTASGCTPPGIRRFELTITPEFDSSSPLKWAASYRPEIADGTLIQTAAPERFLDRGVVKKAENGIMPLLSFQTLDHGKPQIYTEFFMEGGNSLSGIAEDNESSVTWVDGNPVIRWNFQKNMRNHHNLPWQWRNHWGMVVKSAPYERHLPPMVMYHYFDNFDHYPDEECLEAMALCGCQILVMHENWRLDVQDGGIPYNEEKFRSLVANAHRHNIRIAPYIRGNENSVEEDYAHWFYNYLLPDFDGLYMDYGGPFHIISPPDECYQNGRIHFRHHYMKLRELRKTIGRDGVFYVHTGPLFSALGMNFTDGYVSGEGEKGILLKGRLEHEYFSMSSVTSGTLWTAAFPEYGTPAIVPFMAAAGQYPHSTLGVQMPSSSLAHPPVPGINDLPYRKLWKLYRTFGNEKNITVFNDFNCSGIFDDGDPDFIGHYLMISGTKNLLIISNFSSDKRKISINIPPSMAGKDAVLLLDENIIKYEHQEFEIEGFGVAAVLTGSEEEMLNEYVKPYPPVSSEGLKYFAAIKEQLRLRNPGKFWENTVVEIRIPETSGAPYEESLIYDLYSSELFLYRLDENGEKQILRELGALGPNRSKVAFDLAELLPPGEHTLALQSLYGGQPFYSLVEVRMFNKDNPIEEYVVKDRKSVV